MNAAVHDDVQPVTAGRGARLGFGVIEELALVHARSCAHQVSIVRGWANADSLGGATEEVAQVMRELLQGVGRASAVILSKDLIKEDGVMRGSGGTCYLVS